MWVDAPRELVYFLANLVATRTVARVPLVTVYRLRKKLWVAPNLAQSTCCCARMDHWKHMST